MKSVFSIICICLCIPLFSQRVVDLSLTVTENTPAQKVYQLSVENADSLSAFQFSMYFDTTMMTFNDIQSPMVINFNESSLQYQGGGSFISVWLDLDLEPGMFGSPVPLANISFDVIEDGGSDFCFSDTPRDYEFVLYNSDLGSELSDLVIHDDCYDELYISLVSTAVPGYQHAIATIENIHLTSQGQLIFSCREQVKYFVRLVDVYGRSILDQTDHFSPGTHRLHTTQKPGPSVYYLMIADEDGRTLSVALFPE